MLRRALEGCFGAALTAVALGDGRGGGTGSGGSGAAGVEGMVGMAGIDGEEIGYEGWPCGVMLGSKAMVDGVGNVDGAVCVGA